MAPEHSILKMPGHQCLPVPVREWNDLVLATQRLDVGFPWLTSLAGAFAGGALSAVVGLLSIQIEAPYSQQVYLLGSFLAVCAVLAVALGYLAYREARLRRATAFELVRRMQRLGTQYGGLEPAADFMSRTDAILVWIAQKAGLLNWLDIRFFHQHAMARTIWASVSVKPVSSDPHNGQQHKAGSMELVAAPEEGRVRFVQHGAIELALLDREGGISVTLDLPTESLRFELTPSNPYRLEKDVLMKSGEEIRCTTEAQGEFLMEWRACSTDWSL
jgi:hypothetical protein